jgi:hypothetical protein
VQPCLPLNITPTHLALASWHMLQQHATRSN